VWNIWERGETVKELVYRPEVKKSIGRRRRRCKCKYEMYVKVIVWVCRYWFILMTRGKVSCIW